MLCKCTSSIKSLIVYSCNYLIRLIPNKKVTYNYKHFKTILIVSLGMYIYDITRINCSTLKKVFNFKGMFKEQVFELFENKY